MGISNKLLTFHKELKKLVTVKEFRVKICVSVLQQQFLKQLLKKFRHTLQNNCPNKECEVFQDACTTRPDFRTTLISLTEKVLASWW